MALAFADRSVRSTLARAALGGTGEDARLSTNNKKSPALAGLGLLLRFAGAGALAT